MNKRIYLTVIVTTLVVAFVSFCHPFSHRNQEFREMHGVVWYTQYNITYQSEVSLDDSVMAVIQSIDESASVFNKESIITQINAGKTAQADEVCARLYRTAYRVWEASNGLYDPTVAPLVEVWGFGRNKEPKKISPEGLDSILAYVGMGKTHITADNAITRDDNRITFDFSSIAKGYACDAVGEMLERNGVKNYLVEIGGEIKAVGVNRNGAKWHVSVDYPIESDSTVVHESAGVIEISNQGMATSGNYRNFKTDADGKIISHIINPLTGYCERNNLLSATIIAPNAALADALATACMTLGVDRSKEMINSMHDVDGMLIFADTVAGKQNMEVWTSANFKILH